jgi:cell division protein ZapA (FtsZ GTPase activity inhibitor)
MHEINVLGKKYKIKSSLSPVEINKIAKEINEKYKILEKEYPTFDKLDILIFYLIELYEVVYNLKKKLSREEEIKNRIKNKLTDLEKDVVLTLQNLTIVD